MPVALTLPSLPAFFTSIVIGVTIASSTTPEGPPVPACKKRTTEISFVNGVWNPSEADAFESAMMLSSALSEGGVENFSSNYIYSGHQNNISDIVQAMAYQEWGKVGLDFLDALATRTDPTGRPIAASDIPALKESGLLGLRPQIDAIKTNMRESISLNRPMVYVCHSRGSLACNTAYRELQQENVAGLRNIGIFGVATPDSKDLSNAHYDYITYKSDLVIGSVPGALVAKFGSFSPWESDSKPGAAHEFIETYLQRFYKARSGLIVNDNIRAELVNKIKNIKNNVEKEFFPCNATTGTPLLP